MCRASVRLILKLAPPSSIVPVGLRSAEAATLVPDEPLEVRLQAFHVVSATGEHRKGPDALPRLLDALPGMRPVAAALRRSPVAFRGAAASYRWITRNRGLIARFLPSSWARPIP